MLLLNVLNSLTSLKMKKDYIENVAHISKKTRGEPDFKM
jgi:hypothetical protein